MRTSLRRRFAAMVGAATIAGSLLASLAAPGVALGADAGCTALGGVEAFGTCTVSAAKTISGTINVNLNLVLASGGKLDATASGVTLNVSGDMSMANNSWLEADDPASPINNAAQDITLNVGGDLTMAAGSRISADNNVGAGDGGDITITVGGDMSMAGTAGTTNCRTATPPSGLGYYKYGTYAFPNVYGTPTLGARISAHRWGASGSWMGGTVDITVGNYGVPPTGILTIDRCALIDVSSNGSAGEIRLTAGNKADIDGLVLSESGMSGTGAVQPRGGGPINIRAGCDLLVSDTGVISSKGQDPGADLVHLKGCNVVIYGVVQSTAPGAGHALPTNPPNLCNDDPVAHPAGTASGFTGCVRILGESVTIDARGSHNGQVNVDGIRAPMRGWIDIFSTKDTFIYGDPAPAPKWAVSADACPVGSTGSPPCSNSYGGVVTLKSLGGQIVTEGQAVLQANASAIGSDGGRVTIEAFNDVALDGSFIEALTELSGSNTVGGTINVRSYNGAMTSGGDNSGKIDASGGLTPGSVTTMDCTAGDQYLGTIVAGPSINDNAAVGGDCGGAPTVPQDAQALFDSNAPIWVACRTQEGGSKSGFKFNDRDGSHSLTPGDTPIAGWPITLYDSQWNVVETKNTEADGTYEFVIPANGTYRVCEGTGGAGFVQTYPQAGTTPPPGESITSLCPGPNVYGYEFTLTGGENLRADDFGNWQPGWCEKQPVRTVLDPISGQYKGNKGPDKVVRVDLGESVQDAVDNEGDSNSDGFIIIAVSAHADGSLGGSANQKVAVWKDYGETIPFALIGCSVTLTGGGSDPSVWVKETANAKNITVNSRTTDIFVMDLHGAGSSVAGVQVDGNYRYLRNEYGQNSAVGIKVNGSYNTVHNGSATGNNGDGLQITGSYNLATDTNSMSNGGNGVAITGDRNTVQKLDVGEKNTPNTLDGIQVVGAYNTLSENDVYNNGEDGIDVAGNNNTLTKNNAGDKGKGNGWSTGLASAGIRVAGWTNTLTENKAASNKGDGFNISGDTAAGQGAHANLLKNNLSNTSTSGNADYENAGKEWRLLGWIKNNGGGNKADSVLLANGVKGLTNFPASGATFNYAVEQTAE